jgi:predicted transcriptional regulator of viral defense system
MSMTQNKQDLITVREARNLLGVSPAKMAQLISKGILQYWSDPLDARVKLVSRSEVLNLTNRADKAA